MSCEIVGLGIAGIIVHGIVTERQVVFVLHLLQLNGRDG